MADRPSEAQRALERLGASCQTAMAATFEGAAAARFSFLYTFANELECWRRALKGSPELALFDVGQAEYLVAMMNAAQGQYRNAFKALRLVLELYLQGVLLSTDLVALREWLSSGLDTRWSQITGDDGVFGIRFVRALFPGLERRRVDMHATATDLYRGLSECIHGNVPAKIPLPNAIAYDEASLRLWIDRAETTQAVVHFALAVRYLGQLGPEDLSRVEAPLLDRFGDVPAVRSVFGGRVE